MASGMVFGSVLRPCQSPCGLHLLTCAPPLITRLSSMLTLRTKSHVGGLQVLSLHHLLQICISAVLGVVPKSNQPGKWRLILDLSSPVGHSVNNGIPKSPFSIQYVTVDAFIDGIMARGRGTLLAKFDVASAYRNVAVHPLDRPLLGMKWRDKYYVDMALPFGLRSAPYIFTAIADAVQWMLTSHHGVDFLRHYLDDFLTMGPPASPVCYNNLQACIQLCSKLGLPLHPDKLEGPSTCLSILGIELDTIRLQARLPTDKRERIVTLLKSWSGKRFCRRRELESLIGHLHHACKIAPQGRTVPSSVA